MVKFQISQFESLQQEFCKFEGHLKGQGHQFLKIQDLKMINTQLKFETKNPNGSKVHIHKELHKIF